jgi:hypothetical protein
VTATTREAITVDLTPAADDEVRTLLMPTGAVIAADGTYYADAEQWALAIYENWRLAWTAKQKAPAAEPPIPIATIMRGSFG